MDKDVPQLPQPAVQFFLMSAQRLLRLGILGGARWVFPTRLKSIR